MAEELNYYAISKLLNAKMAAIPRVRFGHFSLLDTVGQSIRARLASTDNETGDIGYEVDRVIVQAFENMRVGQPTDRLLWDKEFSRKFVEACRQAGLQHSEGLLKRRLVNVRKNPGRYRNRGIILSPTSEKDMNPSIVPKYAHVIEFALIKLKYLYGASIDDILMEPELGDEFESLCHDVAPEQTDEDLRRGALYIRKSRFVPKHAKEEFEHMAVADIDNVLSRPVNVKQLAQGIAVPSEPGLIEVFEPRRFLYISRNENLVEAIQQFSSGEAFHIVENNFWHPDPNNINIRYAVGSRFNGVAASMWERRLIHLHRPVFNWPVQNAA